MLYLIPASMKYPIAGIFFLTYISNLPPNPAALMKVLFAAFIMDTPIQVILGLYVGVG